MEMVTINKAVSKFADAAEYSAFAAASNNPFHKRCMYDAMCQASDMGVHFLKRGGCLDQLNALDHLVEAELASRVEERKRQAQIRKRLRLEAEAVNSAFALLVR